MMGWRTGSFISSPVGRLGSYLYGKRFGKLIAIRIAERRGERVYWLCACDCGKQRSVLQADLKKGRITNCGYCPA